MGLRNFVLIFAWVNSDPGNEKEIDPDVEKNNLVFFQEFWRIFQDDGKPYGYKNR